MLRPRIIPCLLIRERGLVKTVNFKNEKYVGDPLNAVRIFNDKKVDELMFLDIDATTLNREPDYELIRNIASASRMPLCYGGGIKNSDQARKILNLGVEKIAISSIVHQDFNVITEMSKTIGSQSVVIVVDVRKKMLVGYQVLTHNGKVKQKINLIDFIKKLDSCPIGEIVINSIHKDGLMEGYDYDLINAVRNVTTKPITALGGVGEIEDIELLIKRFGVIGAGVGSLFVFKGKYKAVLINYPSGNEKKSLIKDYL